MLESTCIHKTAESIGQPEFLRLPTRGGDPIFGLCRSTWYNLEARGIVRLRRLRSQGNVRGIVLIPVAAAREALRKATEEGGE